MTASPSRSATRGAVTVMLALVPLISVLIGAGITYQLNVRTRTRTRVEDTLHDTVSAVAIAAASHHYLTSLAPWQGATPEEYGEFTSQLGKEGQLRYVRAVADARTAIARASSYEPDLRRYYVGSQADLEAQADEIIALLRAAIARRSGSRFMERDGHD